MQSTPIRTIARPRIWKISPNRTGLILAIILIIIILKAGGII
jgi:hypothetical protein